jgi:HAD superfamily hydrolase (TIGR01549 family)
MRPIETVFLDAGGVLVFPNWQRVSEILADHGVTVAADALRHAEPDVKFAIDTALHVAATNDAQRGGTLFEGVLDRAGVPRSAARAAALADVYAYHMANNIWEDVDPDASHTLAALRAHGFKLAIVSNANGVVQKAFERCGLDAFFDVICDSHLEGVEKPDPRFFQVVLERTNSRPETTIHVGDIYHIDVVGARRAGLRALLLDPHDLYRDFDVERIGRLTELVERLVTHPLPR